MAVAIGPETDLDDPEREVHEEADADEGDNRSEDADRASFGASSRHRFVEFGEPEKQLL
ncbi:MAG: hypothetical protein RI560_07365 [Natronomonas sp.]|uniref:hypothetical protein n=1 Tax=Natronomonas sp. TaxID=2184060 RepID=UPI0028704CED|nr:hypothetical protein [Natronomonas sp.]MDR9381475.1 hypothetical protein [Natronomonas sp.]MDR9429793.1 hypothetical protein [Natronomonas sp.]